MRIADNVLSFKRNWPAWLLLTVGLGATASATVKTKLGNNADERREFEFTCDEITWRIDARMQAHAQILRSGAALFFASDQVSRQEWKTYTIEQKVAEHLPGIQGIGFSVLLQPNEMEAHVAAVRSEGFPDYQVTPPGPRPIYTAIIYLEPFDARNRRAFGYDMYSEPVRRKAMDQAANNDVAALSGRVTLLQETNTDVQAGTLMYVPVYRRGMKTDTVAHRREALRGWVYSPYRMKDLMNGILSERDQGDRHSIRLQVYDREDFDPTALMYDSRPATPNAQQNKAEMIHVIRTDFNGHPWFLRFSRPPDASGYKAMFGVSITGIIISLLLFGMISLLQVARRKAQQLADQLKVEAELEGLNQQLQKNESLHRMAGAIAHHFNNKLGAVIGNLELASADLPKDASIARMLNAAMKSASGAAEISAQMLTYLGQSAGMRMPHNLSQIVEASLSFIRTVAPKVILIQTELPGDGPIVSVDKNQIQQILTNLATNAFEAADRNQGRVNIKVTEISSADLPVENRFPVNWQPAALRYASLEVSDTGVGIAKSDFNKLFDPFFSSHFTGRGLGLAAVLGIARAHGGAVAVESVQGVGSLFRVFLPICEQSAPAPESTPRTESVPTVPSAAASTEETVLVVEDDAVLRTTAEAMLRRLGYRVLTAEDGEVAVQIFQTRASEIHIVLCDLSMPRMDGWKTLEALREIRPDIPVVLTSGHVESMAMSGKHKEGPQLFLHKPYRKAQLQSALTRAMHMKTPPREP